TQLYPNPGWVEHDPMEIWASQSSVLIESLARAGIHSDEVAAIGITNQRETSVIWDRKTGEPVYNAIVWQDRRTADYCAGLKEKGLEKIVSDKTGLLLDPYFSATKINWILENVEGVRARAENGELAFGTIDSWLLWNLSGGKVHATDITNASRTMLFNIKTLEWDDELLGIFNVPKSLLPEVKDNVAEFGVTDLFGKSVSILGMAGDQHAAMIGQACFEPGMIKSTYGTGCFALMNIGAKFRPSQNRLLTTIAYKINGELAYAIEGSIFVAGAVIQWLRDNVNFFEDSAESEKLAMSVPDSGGVYFVPAFTGLGAPYWEPEARAAIFGLTRDSTKAHITRAALEAQGFQTLDLMDAMEKDGGHKPEIIRVDGGLTANDFVCQFISDMIDCPVEVPKNLETTALGAAYLAGLGVGIFKDLKDIQGKWMKGRHFKPEIDTHLREKNYAGWKDCIKKILDK
ncbi:MAG: glycerol kinase, partial [Micavibrio aeruginosavorus]